jgi:hypothetical protein
MEIKMPTKTRRRPRQREKKSTRMTVWVSPPIKERLTGEADELGIALSAYAGDRLSRDREVYIAEGDRKQVATLRFQLFKLDSNLGRIAGALENLAERGQVSLPPLGWLERVTEEVSRQLAQLDAGLYELRPFNPGG